MAVGRSLPSSAPPSALLLTEANEKRLQCNRWSKEPIPLLQGRAARWAPELPLLALWEPLQSLSLTLTEEQKLTVV